METLKHILLVVTLAFTLFSCKKDKENEEIVESIKKEQLLKKITEIIPKQYQDSLVKLGIVINQEVNPPALSGAYLLNNLRLIKSNISTDVASKSFSDVQIKFFGQDADNNIKYVSKTSGNNGTANDTSIVTAISGSGKQFTVYGRAKSVNGVNTATFGYIYSGEVEGNSLKNVRFGLINIDNSKGGNKFVQQGQGRVIKDDDLTSETISFF